jgi:hypothetical protein
MDKHTPGPWTVCKHEAPSRIDIQENDAGYTVASAWGGGGVEGAMTANAHLIAAAPDLLRHLEHLAGACERFAPHILTNEARAAIAKAKEG